MRQRQGNNKKMKAKILLLHGWDWKKYPKFNPTHQWENRQEFIDVLQKKFDIEYPTLPGFNVEDTVQGAWTLQEYARWLNEKVSKNSYDLIIGYSFGSAVITQFLYTYKSTVPVVLISPAIIRAYAVRDSKVKNIGVKILTVLHLEKIKSIFTSLYLTYIVKNKFYIHGNDFLRNTYRNIVRIDVSDECREILKIKKNILFIFGEKDTATPPQLFLNKVPEAGDLTLIIPNADHNVAGTHPEELAHAIHSWFLQI